MVDRIKEFAKKKNTNLAQIERALGFSQGYIRKWDTQKPSYDRIFLVAQFLNVPIDALVDSNIMTNCEIEIIQNFREADDIGKETIMNIAELQALRSRRQKTETRANENVPLSAQKIQFPNRKEDTVDKMKPFA